ncbi:MAG: YidC/Oxa1 family insertase periplasmic-domain containing protein [Myxococcaceae bacterium]|nr:YidC/Oxa1 family insertase periplasmic-domain containing protein [Myxococcaceae bacterium]MCI0673649.1 YidC/Oxa1 family insertase periplasmic-domain containing protein [Myxococcaceae bacterium]
MPPQDSSQQKRLMLALLLTFALTAVYTMFLAPKPPVGEEGMDAGVAAVAPVADAGVAAVVPPPVLPTQPGVAAPTPGEEAPPARELTVQRPKVTYKVSTQGGGLSSAVLLGEKNREQQRTSFVEGWKRFFGGSMQEPPQMDMAVPPPQGPLPMSVSISGGSAPLPEGLAYGVESESAEGVSLRGQSGPWAVTKRFAWPGEGYQLFYTVTVSNTSQTAQSGELTFHNTRAVDPQFEEAPSMLGAVGNQARVACFVEEKQHVVLPKKDEPPESFSGPVKYFGIDLSYFTSQLFFLEGPKAGRCTMFASPTVRKVDAAFPLTLQPGQSVTFTMGGYLGPKDTELLAAVPSAELARAAGVETATLTNPNLGELVDFGIWAVLAKVLLGILRFFHGVAGNWGLAIVLLTLLVKVVLFPLTVKQMASAEDMKKLQPRMEAIRKKYSEDKERQQMETLKLYQEAKVNPLGGCLPLLLQMPVWIALYTTLRTSFDIYNEPFFGPVWNDLTFRDPTFLIPLLLGVTMIITQKMQPQMMDAAQARMMTWVLPIVFTFMMLQIPAGLTLYIFTNNILTVGQQYGLRKWMERRKTATA